MKEKGCHYKFESGSNHSDFELFLKLIVVFQRTSLVLQTLTS